MIVIERTAVEYTLRIEDDGYAVLRDGERYDYIPFELVRIYVDDDTLLESYLEGAFAYETDNLPPDSYEK